MDTIPTITVCVTAYNQAKYIRQTLDGILAQKDVDFHIIVADNCSPDNTIEILQKYKANYPDKITIINQPENLGLVRNLGICTKAAKSPFIAICEGDDFWIDDYKLRKQLNLLEADSSCSFSHTAWTDLYEVSGKMVQSPISHGLYAVESQGGKKAVEEIMQEDYRGIRFSSILYRRDIILQAMNEGILTFNTKYSTMDIAFFYALAYFGKAAYLPDYTTAYRIQAESISSSSVLDKKIGFSLGCLYIYRDFILKLQLDKNAIDRTLRRSFQFLYPAALMNKDKKLAQELARIANECGYKLRIGQRLCHLGASVMLLNYTIKRLLRLNL